ncbi:hypothetical protein J1TS3_26210 [Siminovitchia fordii]|uniref:Uncharacterized protein n=1 Tax=Siminovitchia fordii TaxID=254759 RepID=A0ABQ4K6X8_9BACI|nr:hypothetical protein J1TS3_26210 [Siminovitchia fordii]
MTPSLNCSGPDTWSLPIDINLAMFDLFKIYIHAYYAFGSIAAPALRQAIHMIRF